MTAEGDISAEKNAPPPRRVAEAPGILLWVRRHPYLVGGSALAVGLAGAYLVLRRLE